MKDEICLRPLREEDAKTSWRWRNDYAKAKAKSLNQVSVDMLAAGLGIFRQPAKNEELRALAQTWVDDPDADKAFAEMRTIDEGLWK